MKLIPFISVGEFKFNTNIENYTSIYKFAYSPCDDITGWDKYKSNEFMFEIYTLDSLIVSIACRKQCIYKRKNLIEMLINDFISTYKINPDKIEKMFIGNEKKAQKIYEFDSLGLQIWVRDTKIVTIFCSPKIIE